MSKSNRAPFRVSKANNGRKVSSKKGKGFPNSGKGSSHAAVVTLDPFMTKKAGKNAGNCSPPELEQDIKLESLDGNLICRWKLGSKGLCNKHFDSPDELIEHLLENHARCGTRGYVCCWENCSKRSVTHYNTRNEFKDHLKFHTVISPYTLSDDINNGNKGELSDESYEDNNEEDSTDSDYNDSSDEEFIVSKRKRKTANHLKTQAIKRHRSGSVESSSSTKQTINLTPSIAVTAVKTIGNSDLTPVALSFYRFTCMWVVRFTVRAKNTTQEQNVICHRKFTIIEDSIEHLRGHHVSRLKELKEPLKCLWKGCTMSGKVFKSLEELNEHVIIHTEEKMLTFNSNLTLHEDASKRSNVLKSTPATEAVKTNASISKDKTPEKTKTETSSKSQIELTPSESSDQEKGNMSWMVSVLRGLLSAQLKFESEGFELCQASQACMYCRFRSLKNRLSRTDNSVPFSMYEFTLLVDRFKECLNNPIKFFVKLFDDLVCHESVFHSGKSIKRTFWVKHLKGDIHGCTDHALNRNIVNLFPVQYKNCTLCTQLSEYWPKISHLTLIITLDLNDHTKYPDILMVKGRVYQLSAVICKDNSTKELSYFTYVRMKNMWISYFETSSNMADTSQVFSDKGAYILIYTDKSTGHGNFKVDGNSKIYEYGDCNKGSLPDIHSNEVCDRDDFGSDGSVTGNMNNVSKKKEGFVALFRCRQLINDGNESCINAALQALLQTGLATVVKKLCKSSDRCYFCRMLSFTQRAICSPGGTPIKAFELVLHKEELNIGHEEGSPAVYISDLVGEIVSDERAHHNSGDAKSRFMIRLQKKSCSCTNTCEAYHWAVSPRKKNEALLDLMMACTIQCTQCNVMTRVRPLQMPDNLIVTIEKSEANQESSVHYPDEWASCDVRYFLTSVIVDDPKYGNGKEHFFTYCKVFGKWMCYDDEKVTNASSSDVLGNKRACVLIYVTKELTPQLLQNALADARCYTYKNKEAKTNPAEVKVKEEPLDEYFEH